MPEQESPRPRHLHPRHSARSNRAERRRLAAERGERTVSRLPILVGLAALLVAGVLVDRFVASPTTATGSTAVSTPAAGAPATATGGTGSGAAAGTANGNQAAGATSVVAPGNALTSSWVCGGATDRHGAEAPGRFEVTNDATRPLTGTATVVSSGRARRVVSLHVPPRGHATVPEQVPGGAAWVGAIVTLDGGLASVDQEIGGRLGASSTPCATTGSRSWYFTSGATLVNAGVELNLMNPYPSDAIVDLTLTTNQGVEQPGDFQGLVVPARGLLAVDLGSHLRRRTRIATTVTARTGQIVAWKTDVVTPPKPGQATIGSPAGANAPDPAAPVGGVVVTLGSPAAATRWTWPEGDTGNGFDEQYAIYNPGAKVANVALTVGLDQGSAEPVRLSVAPESVATVVSNDQARIPAGVGHFAQVESMNGVPVVAERTLAAAKPSAIAGLGELPGIRAPASSWLFGADTAPRTTRAYLVVENPNRRAVRVSVATVGGADRPRGTAHAVSIPGGRRASLALAKLYKGAGAQAALVVNASAPILVERDLYGNRKAREVSLSPGVAFSSQAKLAR